MASSRRSWRRRGTAHGVRELERELEGKENGSGKDKDLVRTRPIQKEQEDKEIGFEMDMHLVRLKEIGSKWGIEWGKELGKDCERQWGRWRPRGNLHRCGSGRENKNRGRSSLYQLSMMSRREDLPGRCWRSIVSRRS